MPPCEAFGSEYAGPFTVEADVDGISATIKYLDIGGSASLGIAIV